MLEHLHIISHTTEEQNKLSLYKFDEASFKGVVNCQNSRDKGPPEGNSARG